MTTQELERLEAAAHVQCGKDLGTTIALTPRTLLDLCLLARRGKLINDPAYVESLLELYSQYGGNDWAEHYDQNAARQWMVSALIDAANKILEGKPA